MSDGNGCKCAAYSESECCREGVDWTPQAWLDDRELIESQAAQIEQLRTIIDEEAKDSAKVIIERDQLSALCDQLGEALAMVEWDEYEDPDWGTQVFCPNCRMEKKHGHYECRLGAALSAWRQWKEKA